MKAGHVFHLAFSPEPEDAGNPNSRVGRTPKVASGLIEEYLVRAIELYSSAVDKMVPVSPCRAAEATKLFENI